MPRVGSPVCEQVDNFLDFKYFEQKQIQNIYFLFLK